VSHLDNPLVVLLSGTHHSDHDYRLSSPSLGNVNLLDETSKQPVENDGEKGPRRRWPWVFGEGKVPPRWKGVLAGWWLAWLDMSKGLKEG